MNTTTMYRLAPVSDPTDFYAAGYDGNAFLTEAEAEASTREEPMRDTEWTIVEVDRDDDALRMAGYAMVDGVLAEVGDWIAAGRTESDADYGRVTAISGVQITVAWEGSETETKHAASTLTEQDGELFTSQQGARDEYLERIEAAKHARHEGYDAPGEVSP